MTIHLTPSPLHMERGEGNSNCRSLDGVRWVRLKMQIKIHWAHVRIVNKITYESQIKLCTSH